MNDKEKLFYHVIEMATMCFGFGLSMLSYPISGQSTYQNNNLWLSYVIELY